MGLVADAIAIAAGELSPVQTADALEIARARQGRPIPLAAHHVGDCCAVFFVIKRSDEWWRTEVVPVQDGDVYSWGGGDGDMVLRSEVEPGQPFAEAEGRQSLLDEDDDREFVQVSGVSADAAVRMRCEDRIVAETTVAPHGYFVLAAIVPADAPVTVEAA